MDALQIKQLMPMALTDNINDREKFMKGINYSYYYEQENKQIWKIINQK